MVTDAHLTRLRDGTLPSGRIRAVVDDYAVRWSEPDPRSDMVYVTVLESDVPGIVEGQCIHVFMPESKDPNFGVMDLKVGFPMGDLDPVSQGSEVTFEHCEKVDDHQVEAASYDVASIVRPQPSPGMG